MFVGSLWEVVSVKSFLKVVFIEVVMKDKGIGSILFFVLCEYYMVVMWVIGGWIVL